MSKLGGHAAITRQAVEEISEACVEHLIAKNLSLAGLPMNVVQRDLIDIPTGGHWADFAQKHHFMRRFDGQSPREAYAESVEWIRTNAIQSAQYLARRIKLYTKNKINKSGSIASHAGVKSCGLPNMEVKEGVREQTLAMNILYGAPMATSYGVVDWQPFGNALHALQDSFAQGHATRGKALTETAPGAIEYIKIYAGEDVEGHSDYDKLWEGENPGEFSLDGRLAINASKSLILMIIKTAQSGIDGHKIVSLLDWEVFKGKWLVASEKLSNARDFAIDLIEKYHTGARVGYTNWVTTNFDEDGLATEMVTKFGSDSFKIYAVFDRLDKGGYTTDIDDIALLYIKKIKNNIGIVNSIRGNKKLVDLLVKSMDEGFTSKEEEGYIDFLKGK